MAIWDFFKQETKKVNKNSTLSATAVSVPTVHVVDIPENAEQAITAFAKLCKEICDYEERSTGGLHLKDMGGLISIRTDRVEREAQIVLSLYFGTSIYNPDFLKRLLGIQLGKGVVFIENQRSIEYTGKVEYSENYVDVGGTFVHLCPRAYLIHDFRLCCSFQFK